MKILVVIDGLGTGGAERSLAELAPLLEARGFELEVAYFHERSPGVADALRENDIRLRRLRAAHWITRCLRLRREIRCFKPALVHATLVGPSITARIAAAGTGVPVLTTLVGTTYTPPAPLSGSGLRPRLVKAVDSWTARHLNAGFHAISQAVATDAEKHLRIARESIEVIPRGRARSRLGWPSRERAEHVRRALAIPNEAELVLCVGRQEARKGHVTLIEAWPRVAEARPQCHLVFAGRKGLASPAIARAREELPDGIRERMHFVGHTEDVGGLLSAATIFVFPSQHEGLGGALLEALAMSLPVVASDLPTFGEFLVPSENAVLVPPGCASAFAEAILRLLDDEPLRVRMAARNLALFESTFQLDGVAQKTDRLYRRVALRDHAS
jgi:glycosyltransferase involved in cell wall biosynthesis